MKNVKFIVSLLFIISLFLAAVFISKRQNKELDKYGQTTTGVVYEIFSNKWKSYVRYYFFVGIQKYTSSGRAFRKYRVGDTILIHYSSETPSINRIK